MVECTVFTNTALNHLELTGKLTNVNKYSDAKNYASAECAKVVETNPEAKKASHIMNDMIDEYMLNPCKTKIWFVIELCETIQATHIEIANYELFSSTPKDFTVYFSDIYPASDWKLVGQFTATDSRTLQAFDLNQVGFGKFIRVELHSHYGNEHYCPISEVKVYGASMVDEYEKSEKPVDLKSHEIDKAARKPKRRTSAYRVYRNMMTDIDICGLSRSLERYDSDVNPSALQQKEQPPSFVQPQPTPQPLNRTMPLKPSIFVELSNKVKALETSSKNQEEIIKNQEEFIRVFKDKIERRLIVVESKLEKFISNFNKFALIVIACIVYKLMLDIM